MSSHFTCCGCWPAFVHGIKGTRTARTYRSRASAKYNEREYSIEFEDLIEEEDFYSPSQDIVTDVERDLLSRGKFGELLKHESDIGRQQDAKLREKEENARLEDEAYIQAKMEASRVAKQTMRKQMHDKSKLPNMSKLNSFEFSKWLSEEKIDITSPELDVEGFESFVEKVRAKSSQDLQESLKRRDASVFEQTLSQGLAATKIAGDALSALQPVELHAVCTTSDKHGSVELSPLQEESQLLAIPDVVVKITDNSSIQTSQVPVRMQLEQSNDIVQPISKPTEAVAPAMAQPSELKEMVQDNVENPVEIDLSISQEAPLISIPPVTSPPSRNVAISDAFPPTITHDDLHITPCSQLDNGLQSKSSSTTATENCETQDLNAINVDVLPDLNMTNIDVLSNLNTMNDKEQFVLNTEDVIDQHGRLIDLSPMIEPSNFPLPDSTTISSKNQSKDETNFQIQSNVNTPAKLSQNLKPVGNNVVETTIVDTVATDTIPCITNVIEVESFKLVAPSVKEETLEILEDSHVDDDFNDFDDDFVSSNTNGGFEDYLI